MFEFQYYGGIYKPSQHILEKFMLFVLVGGEEVSLYHMLRDGLIKESPDKKRVFLSQFDTIKIFISQQGFGIPKRYHSFYLQLRTMGTPSGGKVTILPFSLHESQFHFMANAKFLTKKQILDYLPQESGSKKFLAAQGMLPLTLLKEMIQIRKPDLKKGVRVIRFERKQKTSNARGEIICHNGQK